MSVNEMTDIASSLGNQLLSGNFPLTSSVQNSFPDPDPDPELVLEDQDYVVPDSDLSETQD
eukprot:scaffold15753_cov48-Attheya_sp.AAC.1